MRRRVIHQHTTKMSTESLSALLELGEKQLNEGDYLKLATFLKGLKDAAKPVPTTIKTNKMDLTLQFQSMYGKQCMRICIDSVRSSIYSGPTPNEHIISGSINGTPVEMDQHDFLKKVVLIYRLYGMKNIIRTTSLCEPLVFENIKKFKEWSNEHNAAEALDLPDDADSDTWNTTWLCVNLYGLNVD